MLLRFQFSNFRSFRAEQELSLIPVPFRGTQSANATANFPLSVAGIYGANASGKTNVLRAVEFMRTAVIDSHSSWKPDGGIPRQPFVGSDDHLPSRFVMDFEMDGIRYQYGFAVTSTDATDEWLYVFPKGKRQVWYSREAGVDFDFGAKLRGENETIRALTRRNSLFLSAAAQNNHEQLSPVYRWFSQQIFVLTGDREQRSRGISQPSQDTPSPEQLQRYLSMADLGIVGAVLKNRPQYRTGVHGHLTVLPGDADVVPPPPGVELVPELKLVHQVGDNAVLFEREQESDGTLAYLDLLGPILKKLATGGLLCVDELDASLHPILVAGIVKLFREPAHASKQAQLIFTAHNTNLMATLGRDQIWFAEKDTAGASQLYPLSDFKPRRQENLELGYVQGRYGAIPLITPTLEDVDEADGAQ
jgi:uncharacterized protein